jgi:TPR repeat protein
MNALGYKYQYGTGVKADIERAVHWYCQAIAEGNPRAMNNLAILLDADKYLPRDVAEARELWRQAADGGDVNAAYNLGVSLLSEPGGHEHQEAVTFVQRAAMGGHLYAQKALRQWGYQGSLPQPRDNARLMRLQPAHASPGHTKVCGAAVS